MTFVRKIDNLGRVTFPKELRKLLQIEAGSHLEFTVSHNQEIVIRKYISGCTFCGSTKKLISIKGKPVCHECISFIEIKGKSQWE